MACATYLLLLTFSLAFSCASIFAAEQSTATPGWTRLFNGTNLDGWHIVIRNARSDDPDHLVQIDQGQIHMYKDAPAGSSQPAGYIITEKEYSHYHLKLEYRWGEKRFKPRANGRRDAGILYHVVGKDGVWPKSIECQIQENDVGDIFTVNTRLTALAMPGSTNPITILVTNANGAIQTNHPIQPIFLDPEAGGVAFIQGVNDGIRRVIRNPMNEHEGWNTVELIVHGDDAIYVVNGKVNNHATKIQQKVDNQWVPLTKGRFGLQLEFAEVYYRNVELKELTD
jgi:Domain of Unknown Function (DUF1080).